MTTFSEVVTKAGTSNAADTFEEVGVVTLNDKAHHIVGLIVAHGKTTTTTAEATASQVRIRAKNAGVEALFPCAGCQTQNATNVSQEVVPLTRIPLDIPISPGSKVTVEYAQAIAATAGEEVAVQLIYADTKPSDMLYMAIAGGFPLPCKDGDTESGAAKATTETAITALDVPASATEITGFWVQAVPDAVATAGENVVGSVTFRSNLTTFQPQEVVLNAHEACLGTPVSNSHIEWIHHPVSIPTYGMETTITPYVKFVVATTGDNYCNIGVSYR